MKNSTKIFLGIGILTLSVVAWALAREFDSDYYDAERISEEGYETAHDILYPSREYERDKDLHFGPVIPGV